jgi:hypothetical protein
VLPNLPWRLVLCLPLRPHWHVFLFLFFSLSPFFLRRELAPFGVLAWLGWLPLVALHYALPVSLNIGWTMVGRKTRAFKWEKRRRKDKDKRAELEKHKRHDSKNNQPTHFSTHTLARTHTHTHTHLRARTHARTHAHTHTHARAHARTHTHTHTHTNTHRHTQTHIFFFFLCRVLIRVGMSGK